MAEPTHQPPVYAPNVVAEAILAAAESPRRDVVVGGGAKVLTAMQTVSPRLADRIKSATSFAGQHSTEAPYSEDTLHAPHGGDARTRGRYRGRVIKTSLYTRSALHPLVTAVGAAAVGLGVLLLARSRD